MSNTDHTGHRDRMREKLAGKGRRRGTPTDTDLLETALYLVNRRRDVKPQAELLLSRFGDAAGILDAEYEEICSVPGIGESTAYLIELLGEISRRAEDQYDRRARLLWPEDIHRYLIPRLEGMEQPPLYFLCFDQDMRVLDCTLIGSPLTNPEGAFEQISSKAVRLDSKRVVTARGIPEGPVFPDEREMPWVSAITRALREIDILHLDHILFSKEKFYSLARMGHVRLTDGERGLYRPRGASMITSRMEYDTSPIFPDPVENKD